LARKYRAKYPTAPKIPTTTITLNKLGMAWFPQGCPDPPGLDYDHFCRAGARRIFGRGDPKFRLGVSGSVSL
jgi:hypothetical protein